MAPWKSRLAHLTMVGTLGVLTISGCGGGGDVPDPENDTLVAADPAAPSAPAAAPAAEDATPAEAPPRLVAALSKSQGPAEAAPTATASVAEATPATAAATVTSTADSAATSELLNLANNSNAATPAAGGEAAAPAAGTAPGFPGGGYPGGGAPPTATAETGANAAMAAAYGANGAGGPPRGPGAPGGAGGFADEGGFAGQSGIGSLGSGAAGGPADFATPGGAVNAFLMAVQAKDRAKIAQATARRAPTEAAAKNREFFKVLLEESVADDQLDELAKAFEGYRPTQLLQAVSTAQRGVLLSKSEPGGASLSRTVQVRKEKDGWKVLDFTGFREFKAMPGIRPRRR